MQTGGKLSEDKYYSDWNAGIRKSTVGVLLAKRLGYSFVDADIVIQEKTGKLLKEIIAEQERTDF